MDYTEIMELATRIGRLEERTAIHKAIREHLATLPDRTFYEAGVRTGLLEALKLIGDRDGME